MVSSPFAEKGSSWKVDCIPSPNMVRKQNAETSLPASFPTGRYLEEEEEEEEHTLTPSSIKRDTRDQPYSV
jgi:hypothetical protein